MSFDVLAPHYTWLEAVLAGRRLQRARTAWLEQLAGCSEILIAGVGHGHFLRRCAQRFPQARFTSVDASAAMLARAAAHAQRAEIEPERTRFIHATLPGWRPERQGYDAVVTHFFLDCFPPDELADVMDVLAAGAGTNAVWLLSDFAIPSRGIARQRARAIHAIMYGCFRRVTRLRARRLTEPDPLLAGHGFTLRGRRTSEWGLLRADWWVRDPGRRAAVMHSQGRTTTNRTFAEANAPRPENRRVPMRAECCRTIGSAFVQVQHHGRIQIRNEEIGRMP